MEFFDFNALTQLTPPVALGLSLIIAGAFLKQSPVQNWIIPWILMAVGGVLYPMIGEVGKVSYNVRFPAAFNAVIGVCIGGFAVGMHQGFKQAINFFAAKKAEGLPKGDTNLWKRSKDTPQTPDDPPARPPP